MMIIRNGNVYLGNGRYEQGWDVLCDGARIKEIGPNLRASAGEKVIDATGSHVYPGLVLGICCVGAFSFSEIMSGPDMNETSSPIHPELDIRDSFDLRELKMQRFARTGITSYGLCPGANVLIGGQMSLIHSDGARTADVFVREHIGVKGSFTKAVKTVFSPKGTFMTRMGMYNCLDEAFRGAQEYMEKKDAAADDSSKLPPYDAKMEALIPVLRREIPFVVGVEKQTEIEDMIRLGDKYNLRLTMTGGFGAAPYLDVIRSHDWHLMLGDTGYVMTSGTCGADQAALLKMVEAFRNGLNFSICCAGDTGYPSAYEQLLWQAARMSSAGATGSEIMDMMTVKPAEALGVSDVVGTLTPGAYADILIANGNPAERFDSYAQRTIIAGETAYVREGK